MESRSWHLMASIAVCLLALACSSMPGRAPTQDGTWWGGRSGDFNDPLNWRPTGVPTGVATLDDVANGTIYFTASSTTLSEIRFSGGGQVTVARDKSVNVTGIPGLSTNCMGNVTIDGNLGGNLNIGDSSGRAFCWLIDGAGSISGSITQVGATLMPGTGSPHRGVLTAKGGYSIGPNGTLQIGVWVDGATRLDVGGNASLGGTLIVQTDPGLPGPPPPFKALTAASINGQFTYVISDRYKIAVTYNPKDVTVTLSP